LWLPRVVTLDQAHRVIGVFIEQHNNYWLVEGWDHRTPAIARKELLAATAPPAPNATTKCGVP
jgi:hypothetical protein